MIKLIKTGNYEELSKKAGSMIGAQILLKPNSVLGLATGSSPVGAYQELVKWYEYGGLSFSEVTVFNLDEYYGLPKSHEQSYHYFMKKNLFDLVDIEPKNTFIQDGMNEDVETVCKNYEQAIEEAGGIDLQLLGMGHNGHIGFNEPGDVFYHQTHCVALDARTVEANSIYFNSPDEMPKKSYTMGIGTIMRSKKIVVIVSGEEKSATLKSAIYGPITPKVPASILQLHPDVTIIADAGALKAF